MRTQINLHTLFDISSCPQQMTFQFRLKITIILQLFSAAIQTKSVFKKPITEIRYHLARR